MTKDEADDIKRHFDFVMGTLRSDIRQVADSIALLIERMDRFEERWQRKEQRQGRLEGDVLSRSDQVDARLDA